MDFAYGTNIHRTRLIKLKKMDSTNLITIELDSAIISMEYSSVIRQIEWYKKKVRNENRDMVTRINKVSEYLSSTNSYSFDLTATGLRNIEKADIGDFVAQYVFMKLVKTSKIGLYDKKLKRTQTKLTSKYYKVDMEGERHEGYYFEFTDGRLFFERPISI